MTKVFAFFLLSLGLVAIYQVTRIPGSPMYSVVDATLSPAYLSVTFTLSVICYGILSLARRDEGLPVEDQEQPLPDPITRLGWFLAGLILCLSTISPLGFVPASVFAGLGISRAFDAPLNLKALVVVSAIASSFWVLFDQVLSVELGPFAFPIFFGA